MSIELTTLPNGLRIVTDTVPAVDSVAVGVWAGVGTRNEDMAHNGVAHMVEHMMFKGTPTRTAAQIAEQIEDAGGSVNAYTSREVTAYHIHLLKDDLPMALDVLADIVINPSMPEEEVERERGVILQEIGMTFDTPDDLVFDQFQETAYPGQAFGAPILGRADIISAMKRDTLMDYVRRFYTPSRLVISAAGNVDHAEFAARAAALFAGLPPDTPGQAPPAAYAGGDVRTEKDLEQSHVVLGFEGLSRLDPLFPAAAALAGMLGGGMASRLFQEVREKRGLAYSVFAFHHGCQDTGQFAVYAGTGPDRLPELVPVLCDEISKMRVDAPEAELARARAQLKAGLLMSRESMMSRASQQAKHLIFKNEILDVADRIRHIEAITPGDVSAAARRIFSSSPTLAALGPLDRLEPFGATKGRL